LVKQKQKQQKNKQLAAGSVTLQKQKSYKPETFWVEAKKQKHAPKQKPK